MVKKERKKKKELLYKRKSFREMHVFVVKRVGGNCGSEHGKKRNESTRFCVAWITKYTIAGSRMRHVS